MTAASHGAAEHGPAGIASGRARSAYCDTGVIVALVMGEVDPFFDAAVRFLATAKSDGVRLIISSLTIAEAIDVIRKRVKASHRCTDECGRERKAVDEEAEAAARDVIRFVNDLVTDRLAEMYEDITTALPDLERLHKMMLEYRGRTPQARRGNTYRHEGIGPIDWIHIALALLAGAQAICTNDKAIAQIRGDKRYGGMEIIMLRPRQAARA